MHINKDSIQNIIKSNWYVHKQANPDEQIEISSEIKKWIKHLQKFEETQMQNRYKND